MSLYTILFHFFIRGYPTKHKQGLWCILNVQQLKSTQNEASDRVKLPTGYYIVKHLSDHFYDRTTRSYMFLTSWQGYTDQTWEPAASLPEIAIEKYWDSK